MISSYGYHQHSVTCSTSTIFLPYVHYLSHNLYHTTALFSLLHPFYVSTMFGFALYWYCMHSSEICSFQNSHTWFSWQMSQKYQSYMENDNELPADEILGRYGDTINFHLDNIMDPPIDDGEINLIKPSPYCGIDCLPHSLVHTRSQLNILSMNAQSLNSKYDELIILLNITHSQNIWFHVICVQETWLSEMSDYSLVAIDGYNSIHQSKRAECSNHGGNQAEFGDSYCRWL